MNVQNNNILDFLNIYKYKPNSHALLINIILNIDQLNKFQCEHLIKAFHFSYISYICASHVSDFS